MSRSGFDAGVSARVAIVVGLLWLVGSGVLGVLTAPEPGFGAAVEMAAFFATLGLLPAIVMVVVWSHLLWENKESRMASKDGEDGEDGEDGTGLRQP